MTSSRSLRSLLAFLGERCLPHFLFLDTRARLTVLFSAGDQRGHTAQALWTRRRGQSSQSKCFSFLVPVFRLGSLSIFIGSDIWFWLLGGTIGWWTQCRL